MKKLLMFTAILLVSACSMFVADRLSEERKSMYGYGQEQAYCKENPDKCIGNVSKF